MNLPFSVKYLDRRFFRPTIGKKLGQIFELNRPKLNFYQISFNSSSARNRREIRPLGFEPAKPKKHVEITPERLKDIKQEFLMFQSADEFMPEEKFIREMDWENLCRMRNVDERVRYYRYLYRNMAADLKANEKREEARQEREKEDPNEKFIKLQNLKQKLFDQDEMVYGIALNTIFQRITEQVMVRWKEQRLAHHLSDAPKLVMDLSLLNLTDSIVDTNLTLKQLFNAYYAVRDHRQPFHMYFVNTDTKSHWFKRLDHLFINRGLEKRLITITEKSYLDLFPREKLIYLSPDAPKSLQVVDSDRIHIVGALVDKYTTSNTNLTLGIAKRQNIECKRLPLDEYVQWRRGHKSLTLPQVSRILMDVNMTGDWRSALLNVVPQRKLTPPDKEKTEKIREHFNFQQERIEFLKTLTSLQ